MKVSLNFSLIIILLFSKVFSPYPIWSFEDISINLLNSENKYKYTIYDQNILLEKVIIKTDYNGTNYNISSKNYLTVNSTTKLVDFEDIESYYFNKIDINILICPKGKFHPFNFLKNRYIIPNEFSDEGDWDLKCFDHSNGFFLLFIY